MFCGKGEAQKRFKIGIETEDNIPPATLLNMNEDQSKRLLSNMCHGIGYLTCES